MNKEIVISFGLLLVCQTLVWFQSNGSLKWDILKDNIFIVSLMGAPIAYLFILATKYGYAGFGNLWAVRLAAFAAGIITFMILTKIFFGESLDLKNGICLLLIIIVMLIQLFWN